MAKAKKETKKKDKEPKVEKPEDDKIKGEQLKFPFLKETAESRMILKVAIAYKAASKARMEALADEIVKKDDLLSLIHKSGIKPMADNVIRFTISDTKISVTPRDELVKVKLSETEIAD
jgi:hypothetical protein